MWSYAHTLHLIKHITDQVHGVMGQDFLLLFQESALHFSIKLTYLYVNIHSFQEL